MKKTLYVVFIGWEVLCAILSVSMAAETREHMPVERYDLQAKLLSSVLKFSTRRLDYLTVGIVYVHEFKIIAEQFAEELRQLTYKQQPIQVVLIQPDQLDSLDEHVNVLYVTPGNQDFLDRIFTFTAERDIFSCTGIPEYVKRGKIALGFDEYEGRPQILLHLAAAKRMDHDFKNPKFLNLQTTRKLVLIKDPIE